MITIIRKIKSEKANFDNIAEEKNEYIYNVKTTINRTMVFDDISRINRSRENFSANSLMML